MWKTAVERLLFFCISSKADIRNPLSLLAHERSRFATCQWELLTLTDISIPFSHRLVLCALDAGECLFCVQILKWTQSKKNQRRYSQKRNIPFDLFILYTFKTSYRISVFPSPFNFSLLFIRKFDSLNSIFALRLALIKFLRTTISLSSNFVCDSFSLSVLGQALKRLVTVSSMCCHTSTSALSTSYSSRVFTSLKEWDISSWGGLHA